MSSSLSNTNPNSFGGSFNYDSRTGLGIGSLSGGPQKGIGSNWNMGDALSSPKGEYDKELDSDDLAMLKKQESELSINIEDLKDMTIQRLSVLVTSDTELDNSQDFDELDADIESKAHERSDLKYNEFLASGEIDQAELLKEEVALKYQEFYNPMGDYLRLVLTNRGGNQFDFGTNKQHLEKTLGSNLDFLKNERKISSNDPNSFTYVFMETGSSPHRTEKKYRLPLYIF